MVFVAAHLFVSLNWKNPGDPLKLCLPPNDNLKESGSVFLCGHVGMAGLCDGLCSISQDLAHQGVFAVN